MKAEAGLGRQNENSSLFALSKSLCEIFTRYENLIDTEIGKCTTSVPFSLHTPDALTHTKRQSLKNHQCKTGEGKAVIWGKQRISSVSLISHTEQNPQCLGKGAGVTMTASLGHK